MNRAQAMIVSRARSAQEAVLDAIRRQPEVTIHQLCDQLGASFSSVQSRVQRLRADGLVVNREPAGAEGRWFAVQQVPWGRSVFEIGARP